MRPANLLYILSDQHNRDALGCYGHPLVQTPNLDRLAARGARFTTAYTNCPICVPARASLATGRYVHQIGNWDNALPYQGAVPSWGHRLREQGYQVDSIGKLHFSRPEDDHGFTQEIDPLHVVDGEGDILGSIRHNPPFRDKTTGVRNAGPGHSTYLAYDARNGENACAWLQEHAGDEKPWVLFASFVCPHPPYIAPADLFALYPTDQVLLMPQSRREEWPDHPAIAYFRRFFGFAEPLEEEIVRKMIAAYYGVCTYLDQQIGRVLEQVEALRLAENTRILYTSDHGECMGARGLFGKFTMYEEAAAVPLILAGPDVPAGKVVKTPVSLVDSFPTILEAVGAQSTEADHDLPGRSLWQIAQEPDQDRTVFSEYHAVGSEHALYMLRNRRYKFVYYVNAAPQLFDLKQDPSEEKNLAEDPAYAPVCREFEAELRDLLDPEEVDRQAKQAQAERIEACGGEAAVRAKGAFDNSPVPGETPAYRQFP